MFFLSFVPYPALFCETTQARFLHLNHFSMATLGSINHVFGLVVHHDCLYKLFPLQERGGASNQDVSQYFGHWARRTAPHANRAP